MLPYRLHQHVVLAIEQSRALEFWCSDSTYSRAQAGQPISSDELPLECRWICAQSHGLAPVRRPAWGPRTPRVLPVPSLPLASDQLCAPGIYVRASVGKALPGWPLPPVSARST